MRKKPGLSTNGKMWFEVEGVRYYIEDEEESTEDKVVME